MNFSYPRLGPVDRARNRERADPPHPVCPFFNALNNYLVSNESRPSKNKHALVHDRPFSLAARFVLFGCAS